MFHGLQLSEQNDKCSHVLHHPTEEVLQNVLVDTGMKYGVLDKPC